jgi:hypothetical protein
MGYCQINPMKLFLYGLSREISFGKGRQSLLSLYWGNEELPFESILNPYKNSGFPTIKDFGEKPLKYRGPIMNWDDKRSQSEKFAMKCQYFEASNYLEEMIDLIIEERDEFYVIANEIFLAGTIPDHDGDNIMFNSSFRSWIQRAELFLWAFKDEKRHKMRVAEAHFARFCYALALWVITGNLSKISNVATSINVFYDCLYGQHRFASYLKKLRYVQYNYDVTEFRHDYIVNLDNEVEEIRVSNGFETMLSEEGGYDSQFQEAFLPFWKETADDFQWAFKPLDEIGWSEIKDDFEQELEDLLDGCPEEIFPPDELDYAHWISDSSCFEGSIRKELTKNGRKPTLQKFLNFKRAVIPVSPGNIRDSWMGDLDTWFTLKHYSFMFKQLIEPLDEALITNESTVLRRLRFLNRNPNTYWLELDWKKQGLTQPREPLKLILRVLDRRYPNLKIADLITAIDNISVYDKETDKSYNPPRGLGLGHLLELVTIMHLTLIRLSGHKCRVLIDDSIIQLDGSNEYQIIDEMEHLRSLISLSGVILSDTKVVISRAARIAERYTNTSKFYHKNYEKNSLMFLPLCRSFFGGNIAYAKLSLQALYNIYGIRRVRNIYDSISLLLQSRLGHEVHEKESTLPVNLGGWKYHSETSFNQTLREMTKDPHAAAIVDLTDEELQSLYLSRSKIISKVKYKNHFIENLDTSMYTDDPICKAFLVEPWKEHIQRLRECYNTLGFHNAKPQLKRGQGILNTRIRKRAINKIIRGNWDHLDNIDMFEQLSRLKRIGVKNVAIPRLDRDHVGVLKSHHSNLKLIISPFEKTNTTINKWKLLIKWFEQNSDLQSGYGKFWGRDHIRVNQEAPSLMEEKCTLFVEKGICLIPELPPISDSERAFITCFCGNAEIGALEYRSFYEEDPDKYDSLKFNLRRGLEALTRNVKRIKFKKESKIRLTSFVVNPVTGKQYLVHAKHYPKVQAFFKISQALIRRGKFNNLEPVIEFYNNIIHQIDTSDVIESPHIFTESVNVIQKALNVLQKERRERIERLPWRDPLITRDENLDEIEQFTWKEFNQEDFEMSYEDDFILDPESPLEETSESNNMLQFLANMGIDFTILR